MRMLIAAVGLLAGCGDRDRGATGFPGPPEILVHTHLTKHYSIHTDLPQKELEFYGRVFEGFYDVFESEYYKLPAAPPLSIYLFAKGDDYLAFNRDARGPDTPFGYYLSFTNGRSLLVVNLAMGFGTAMHELVHHFVDLGFPDGTPLWFNEGFASFHEKFMGSLDAKGLRVSFGYFSNWRFLDLKANVEKLSIAGWLSEEAGNDQSYGARSLMLFLHRKHLLKKLVAAMRERNGDQGGMATLARVWGREVSDLEQEWKDWIRSQPVDEDVLLVPAAFIKSKQEWAEWYEQNEDRLTWSDEQQRYVPAAGRK